MNNMHQRFLRVLALVAVAAFLNGGHVDALSSTYQTVVSENPLVFTAEDSWVSTSWLPRTQSAKHVLTAVDSGMILFRDLLDDMKYSAELGENEPAQKKCRDAMQDGTSGLLIPPFQNQSMFYQELREQMEDEMFRYMLGYERYSRFYLGSYIGMGWYGYNQTRSGILAAKIVTNIGESVKLNYDQELVIKSPAGVLRDCLSPEKQIVYDSSYEKVIKVLSSNAYGRVNLNWKEVNRQLVPVDFHPILDSVTDFFGYPWELPAEVNFWTALEMQYMESIYARFPMDLNGTDSTLTEAERIKVMKDAIADIGKVDMTKWSNIAKVWLTEKLGLKEEASIETDTWVDWQGVSHWVRQARYHYWLSHASKSSEYIKFLEAVGTFYNDLGYSANDANDIFLASKRILANTVAIKEDIAWRKLFYEGKLEYEFTVIVVLIVCIFKFFGTKNVQCFSQCASSCCCGLTRAVAWVIILLLKAITCGQPKCLHTKLANMMKRNPTPAKPPSRKSPRPTTKGGKRPTSQARKRPASKADSRPASALKPNAVDPMLSHISEKTEVSVKPQAPAVMALPSAQTVAKSKQMMSTATLPAKTGPSTVMSVLKSPFRKPKYVEPVADYTDRERPKLRVKSGKYDGPEFVQRTEHDELKEMENFRIYAEIPNLEDLPKIPSMPQGPTCCECQRRFEKEELERMLELLAEASTANATESATRVAELIEEDPVARASTTLSDHLINSVIAVSQDNEKQLADEEIQQIKSVIGSDSAADKRASSMSVLQRLSQSYSRRSSRISTVADLDGIEDGAVVDDVAVGEEAGSVAQANTCSICSRQSSAVIATSDTTLQAKSTSVKVSETVASVMDSDRVSPESMVSTHTQVSEVSSIRRSHASSRKSSAMLIPETIERAIQEDVQSTPIAATSSTALRKSQTSVMVTESVTPLESVSTPVHAVSSVPVVPPPKAKPKKLTALERARMFVSTPPVRSSTSSAVSDSSKRFVKPPGNFSLPGAFKKPLPPNDVPSNVSTRGGSAHRTSVTTEMLAESVISHGSERSLPETQPSAILSDNASWE